MSQQPDFIEVTTSLNFQAMPTAIRWYASDNDDSYHQLMLLVSKFTSMRSDGSEAISGFAVYEGNKLYNLPLTSLQVVEIAKFDSEQEKLAGIQGVPFVRAPNIGNEIGRAVIYGCAEESVDCLIGLNQLLFQKLLDESKSTRPVTIKISGLCKAKIANSLQTGISRGFLIESNSPILVRFYSLVVEQKIDS